jgi:hypothetical protein
MKMDDRKMGRQAGKMRAGKCGIGVVSFSCH